MLVLSGVFNTTILDAPNYINQDYICVNYTLVYSMLLVTWQPIKKRLHVFAWMQSLKFAYWVHWNDCIWKVDIMVLVGHFQKSDEGFSERLEYSLPFSKKGHHCHWLNKRLEWFVWRRGLTIRRILGGGNPQVRPVFHHLSSANF
jgi:hypothetical protein